MAFAAFDQFGAVKPFFPSSIGGLDGLRVDNRGPGLPGAAFKDTEVTAQGIVDTFPGPIAPPLPKVVVDDTPGRQIVGDKPPRTARPQDIENRINDFSFGVFLRSAASFGGRNEWFENLPFGIIEVGGIELSGFHTAMLSQLATLIPLF